jgi:hypothetical protein
LWIKAVWTILGWWTAAAAAAGADVDDGTVEGAGIMLFEALAELGSLEKAVLLRSLVSLASPSELLPMLCAAEELVGVVISIGSPATGEGADVFMVGVGVGVVVMMGIVRAPKPSSGSRRGALLGTCSVTVAIGSTMVQSISMMREGWCVETRNKEGKRRVSIRTQRRDVAQRSWRKGIGTDAGTGSRAEAGVILES